MLSEELENKLKDFRYERKFFISELSRESVFGIIKMHPWFFTEIYNERFINNIYFDTFNRINFYENVEGNAERVKYRIRWYGNLFGNIEKPVLELKIKNGLLGKKRSFILEPFHFEKGFTSKDLVRVFENSNFDQDVGINIQKQNPVLLNRYRRSYFMSFDKNYRITVDDDQEFYKIKNLNNNFLFRARDKSNIILELKYEQQFFNEAQQITSLFPFRMTKSSKFVRGIEATDF